MSIATYSLAETALIDVEEPDAVVANRPPLKVAERVKVVVVGTELT